MNDDDFKTLYTEACIACEGVNGHLSKRAVNLLLQLVNALREEIKEIRKHG